MKIANYRIFGAIIPLLRFTHISRKRLSTLLAFFLIALLCDFTAMAQVELIVNGGFESGTANWNMAGPVVMTTAPRTGLKNALMGEIANSTDTMYQNVDISPTATAATLSYWYNITSSDTSGVVHDTLTVTIQNSVGSSILATVDTKSNANKDGAAGNPNYHQKTFDLLAYKGQTIRVHFKVVMNATLLSSFRIDDVSVQVTAGPVVTLPTVTTLQAVPSANSAVLNGRVTSNGGSAIVERRFEWAKNAGNWGTGTSGVDYGVVPDANITVSGNDFSAVLNSLQANTIYKYRVYARNSAGFSDVNLVNVVSFTTSTAQTAPSFTAHPANQSVNVGQSATFTVTAGGNPSPSIQWQRSTDGGANWSNLSNDGTHSGVTTTTLTVNGAIVGMNGYRFRAVASNGVTPNSNSNSATLTVNTESTTVVSIKQDFIPQGRNNRPGYPLTVNYITIHDTDNSNVGANALMHANYVKNQDEGADMPNNPVNPKSWHFTVDDIEIYQHLPLSENGWHAGYGATGTGNR